MKSVDSYKINFRKIMFTSYYCNSCIGLVALYSKGKLVYKGCRKSTGEK